MDATETSKVKGLENIKKVVVLMFENRSFDHVFGAFPGANGLMLDGKINPDYYNLADPLQPPCPTSNPCFYPIPVDATKPLKHDFTHDFGDGMMPDLFGPIFTVTVEPPGPVPSKSCTYFSGYANGSPTNQANPGQKTYPATNSGFYTTYNSDKQQGQAALTYFEHDALKVLPTLAENFVLCDNWHCDMPGHTLPNRAFMHCATTGSVYIDDKDVGIDTSPTIFERIDEVSAGDWKIYAQVTETKDIEDPNIKIATLGNLDTRFLNRHVSSYKGAPITDFTIDCEAGTLPFYSFIMCWLPHSTHWTDTSMHPQSMLQGGENLLAAVYNTLRRSKSWEETLLVVTFDENGGLYDHVMPPTTTPPIVTSPENLVITEKDGSGCGNSWQLVSQFDFSLLGPRIPALLISPWLKAGIDKHQYQNTSVVRFLIDKLNADHRANLPSLTERDKSAPDLKSAFQQFGTDTVRDDCPDWIEPYKTLPSPDEHTESDALPYSDGKLGVWTPPCRTMEAPPVAYINELLGIYVSPLPGHADSGKAVTQTFATNADVARYMHERHEAAEHSMHPSGR